MTNYVLAINIGGGLRQMIILFLVVGNFLSINFGFAFLILSWYVRNSLAKQVTFLKNFYEPNAVPTILVICGVTLLVVSVLGVKCALGGRIDEEEFDENDILSANKFLLVFWVLAFGTCIVICTTAFICFLEIYELEVAFGKGLLTAMEKYRTDGALKAELDFLQMEYQCCGIEKYEDWFNISWVELKYLDRNDAKVKKKIKGGFYYGEDVPFSCCRFKVVRPCADTRVLDRTYHQKYSYPTDMTLNEIGCRDALVNVLGHVIFKGIGIFMIVTQLIWMCMTISGRYLETSLKSLLEHRDPPIGYLLALSDKKGPGSGEQTLQGEQWEQDEEWGQDAHFAQEEAEGEQWGQDVHFAQEEAEDEQWDQDEQW